MVIPRAVVRDLHTGVEATRLMSLIMLVFSVSPILAPLTGSGLIALFGWRAVFVATIVVGILGLVLVAVVPRRDPAGRTACRERASRSVFARLPPPSPRLRSFLGLTFIGGLGMASFFAFLASLVVRLYRPFRPDADRVQPRLLGQRRRLHRRVAVRREARRALRARPRIVRAAVIGLLGDVAHPARPDGWPASTSSPVLMTMLFVAFACLGLVIPSTTVLALEEHGPIAGMASALSGTLQLALRRGGHRAGQRLLRRHVAADGHGDRALRGRRLRARRLTLAAVANSAPEPAE